MTPIAGTTVPVKTNFTNNFNNDVVKTFTLSNAFRETFSQSNTITAGLSMGMKFSIEEGVEGIAKAT
jgi:hypothetical protein